MKLDQRIDYHTYIRSDRWLSRHPAWLHQADHRCAMFPWIVVGKSIKGKHQRYAMHHMNYENLGSEKYWWDVVALSPIAHWIIHRVLGGHKQASKQHIPYPNLAQRVAHSWCRLPLLIKSVVSVVFFCVLCVLAFGVGVAISI